jgi:hypothetical protein
MDPAQFPSEMLALLPLSPADTQRCGLVVKVGAAATHDRLRVKPILGHDFELNAEGQY